MFKKITTFGITLWLLFLSLSPILARNNVSVPISPDRSVDLQNAVPITLQFACTIPFLPTQYRIWFGYNARNHPLVSLNTADISSQPFTNVSTGLRNTRLRRTDEFYFTIPINNNMPVFVVTWTNLKTGQFTQMRFKTSDFKPCR